MTIKTVDTDRKWSEAGRKVPPELTAELRALADGAAESARDALRAGLAEISQRHPGRFDFSVHADVRAELEAEP